MVTRSWDRSLKVVLSPGRCAHAALAKLGIAPARIIRWEAGVDVEMFNPGRYAPEALGRTDPAHATGAFNVLYAGPLTPQHGIDLLAESFLIARDRDPRLHLLLVGQSPQQSTLRPRLGSAATFLGCLEPDALASVYASADLFVLPNVADPLGQAVLEAQASGLPVLAIDAGAAAELIESGRSGCLAPADPGALASAIRGLARRRAVLDRLATGGLLAARRRSPERSLGQLARGYAWTLGRLADDDAAPVSEVAGVPRAA